LDETPLHASRIWLPGPPGWYVAVATRRRYRRAVWRGGGGAASCPQQ